MSGYEVVPREPFKVAECTPVTGNICKSFSIEKELLETHLRTWALRLLTPRIFAEVMRDFHGIIELTLTPYNEDCELLTAMSWR